ncbi:pyridoxamine 5'-phosphate oxidase family protein [Streptomyces sp. PTM05]|uniref:Pyridoxamine 5'-phosphate oxidase family protein n=1 Tax=Streptantibioticus parmotrematis TaxID=2873249 RepID=A0ABS7QXF7_9ACTN|nr:pyridoxamine 5'-phosphate oxidase family protein [Streptantibioticus parmotrematis]MBY8887889.1 pyridoxamine 5'-phosphate oxidase family protein [Streptantibioticus parmotrematis]
MSEQQTPGASGPVARTLGEEECLRLIAPGGIGRVAYSGRYDLTVLPVNFRLYEGDIVFRTEEGSTMDEDLRSGIPDAAYEVAFQVDDFDADTEQGWSVLVHGPAYHVVDEQERDALSGAGVRPWAPGERRLFFRIKPHRVSGRWVRGGGGGGGDE